MSTEKSTEAMRRLGVEMVTCFSCSSTATKDGARCLASVGTFGGMRLIWTWFCSEACGLKFCSEPRGLEYRHDNWKGDMLYDPGGIAYRLYAYPFDP